MVRILLADDHDVVRLGCGRLLEAQPGWQVCAEARTGREAVALAEQLRPDVAVLDLTMPELNGLEATRRIRTALPETEVLVFTMHQTEQLMREALLAGARGYLLKSDAASGWSRRSRRWPGTGPSSPRRSPRRCSTPSARGRGRQAGAGDAA